METRIKWIALALSYFLLRRASGIWAYSDEVVQPEFCLTKGDLKVFEDPNELRWADNEKGDAE